MFNMKDRVVLLTGAVNDIGEAISQKMSECQVNKVMLADSDSAGLDELAKRLADKDIQVQGFPVDMTNFTEVNKVVEDIASKAGSIDILVNCIDNDNGKPISESTFDDFDESIRTNLSPVFMFCKSVISKMQQKKYGRIINISDINYLGIQNKSNYSAAKSGIFGLTRDLALELAKDDITVNTVIKSDIKSAGEDMSEDEQSKRVEAIPVQRLGDPADVAYAVCYLAADSSNYVTGQTLFVCGGKSIHSSMSI